MTSSHPASDTETTSRRNHSAPKCSQPPISPRATRFDEGPSDAKSNQILIVACLALATVVSAVSALNVAIPDIARDTGASQTQLSWIVDAYALTFAALLLPAGALGDHVGRRTVLTAGLCVFGAAAATAMFLDDANLLIAARALLGVGAALVMPATLSTITTSLAGEEKIRGVAVWTGVAGASAILGLLASGLLLEIMSWRAIFGVNVALAVVALVATRCVAPQSDDLGGRRMDVLGAVSSIAGLVAIVFTVIEAPTAGWLTARTVVGALAGAVLLCTFVAWEMRCRDPLLDPRLFRRVTFTAGTLVAHMLTRRSGSYSLQCGATRT